MSGVRELPDWALTAWAAGWDALASLVRGGLLPRGNYECPTCRGEGEEVYATETRVSGWATRECGTCLGTGLVEVRASGTFSIDPGRARRLRGLE